MDRFFPNWPLAKKPSYSAYSRKESKWCRMCLENYDYTKRYLSILLDELSYRDGSRHDGYSILQWIESDMPKISISVAKLDKIYLPWKVVEPRYRRIDAIEGYRQQFMAGFDDGDPFKAYGSCCRDIPKFVLDFFNANQAYES